MQGTRGRKKTPYLLKNEASWGWQRENAHVHPGSFVYRYSLFFLSSIISKLHIVLCTLCLCGFLWYFQRLVANPSPLLLQRFYWNPTEIQSIRGWWGISWVDVWWTDESKGVANTRDCAILERGHFSIILPKVIIRELLLGSYLEPHKMMIQKKKWPSLIELFLGKLTF